METVTEARKEEKPYQIKKDTESGKFKILDRKGKPFEGFEDKEFGSPIEGFQFMKKAVVPKVKPSIVAKDGFEIPTLEGREPYIEIIGKERYFEVVLHEQDNTKRTNVFITDGQNRDFLVALDKKAILPEGAINVAKEAIYTVIEPHYDAKEGKAWETTRDVPRFSINILREVPHDEASKWLAEQKKISRKI